MNLFLLYLLLLKATVTSFSGLASIPIVRNDLVSHYQVLSDQQLNAAIVVTRTTPGPMGLYVVSVGYFVAGVPGAIAGWLAMATPALLIVPLIHFVSRKAEHPRIKCALQAVVFGSAGLLLSVTFSLAKDAVNTRLTVFMAIASLAILLTRKVDSLWIILGAAAITLTTSML